MPLLTVHVTQETHDILEKFAEVSGRSIENLAESAVEETALRAAIDNNMLRTN